MIRIGVLGDIGSGKSYVAKSFGYPVFNADREVEKIYKNIHPDLYVLDVETDQILVDDINQVESWVFNKPFEASKKIIIIQSADKMNFVAQSKLLKILEEPPLKTFIFLLSSSPFLLKDL